MIKYKNVSETIIYVCKVSLVYGNKLIVIKALTFQTL